MERSESESPPVRRGPLTWVLFGLGWIFAGLGTVGAVVPLLPTTPFLLLAGACFVRSSPRLHAKLLANPTFGPYIAQWQRDRSVPKGAKRKAYVLVVATFSLSIAVVGVTWLRLMLVGIMAALLGFLWWLPESSTDEELP